MNTAVTPDPLISEFKTDEAAAGVIGEAHDETAYLLSSRKNAEHLSHSIEQIRQHQTTQRDLIE